MNQDVSKTLSVSPYFGLGQSKQGGFWTRRSALLVGGAGLTALAAVVAVGVLLATRPAAAQAPNLKPAAPASQAPDSDASTQSDPRLTITAPAGTESNAAAAGAGPNYAAEKAAAVEMLEARLPTTERVQFRGVRTNVSTNDGQTGVDFCGEVNAVSPDGAYVGFQRFISSRVNSVIEQGASPGDFNEAWRERCSGREGPAVWR